MTRLPIARVPLAVHAEVVTAVGALPKEERVAFWQSVFRQSLEQPTVAMLAKNISARAEGERTLKLAIRATCHLYRLIHRGFTKCSVEQVDPATLRFRVDEFPSHTLSLEHFCEGLVLMFQEVASLCHGKLDITVHHGPCGTSAWLDMVVAPD